MELRNDTRELQTNIDNSKKFSITASKKSFKILSDNLYTDKIRAVIRKLSCNAFDAHVAAGKKETPIEIHLPNEMEPWFSVKDYGTGLSHERVLNLYINYFDSDKTTSNDYTGALGLGSKSPFAYTDSFSITSIYEKEKRFYTCYLDNDGIPNISLLNEEKTDEPNGVEVIVAVHRNDFENFRKTAKSVYYFFAIEPLVNDGCYNFYKEPYVEGTNWIIPKYRKKTVAIQGNVAYYLNEGFLPNITKEEEFVLNNCYELYFNIGDLDVAASREALRNDAITLENLRKQILIAYNETKEIIEKRLDQEKIFGMQELFIQA